MSSPRSMYRDLDHSMLRASFAPYLGAVATVRTWDGRRGCFRTYATGPLSFDPATGRYAVRGAGDCYRSFDLAEVERFEPWPRVVVTVSR